MNLTRQMQGIADLYNQIKPIEEKTYTPAPTTKNLYSSTSDKNSNMLNEMYLNILNKSTSTNQNVLNEATVQPGVDTKKADINKNKKLEDWEIARANKAFGKKEGEEDEVEYQEQTEGRSDSDDMPPVRANIQGDDEDGEHVYEGMKSYSAKQAKKGKDIGKPGKNFKKIAKGAAKKYGSKKAGQKVAGAVLAKLRKEKFEQFGKTKHLMNALNFKLKDPKNYKPAGSGKNTAVKPSHNKAVKNTFLAADELPKEPAFIKNSGPKANEGTKTLEEPIEPGPKQGGNLYQVNKYSQGQQKNIKVSQKINEKNINNVMKNDKSIFDKLYEDVMADDDAIALGATDAALESDLGGDEAEDMGGEEITISMPRDVAEHLHSLLSAVLGGGEEDMGAEEDLGVEDEMMGADMDGEEDEQAIGDDEPMGEEIEAEVLGEPIVKQNMKGSGWIGPKGKNNVVDSTASKLAKPGKGGDSKVTDKVGDDGTEGHPLVNQKKGTDLIGPKHKNTVKSVTTSKVGDTFFQPA